MAAGPRADSLPGLLAKRLDAGSNLFLFGYYLRALEDSADGATEAGRLLAHLHETASRCEPLGPLCAEIGDVARLAGGRTGGGGVPGDRLATLLGRCAKRWFQRVREIPRRRNSLAVDVAFNLELAGMEEVAARLYEAIICLEAGAFRASRLMSTRAMEEALERAGVPAGDIEGRLEMARGNGLLSAAEVRLARANFGDFRDGGGEGMARDGQADWDGPAAEWALEASIRLVKRILRQEIEAGLGRAIASSARTPDALAGCASAPGAKGPD